MGGGFNFRIIDVKGDGSCLYTPNVIENGTANVNA